MLTMTPSTDRVEVSARLALYLAIHKPTKRVISQYTPRRIQYSSLTISLADPQEGFFKSFTAAA
jgi:hypothetical protein